MITRCPLREQLKAAEQFSDIYKQGSYGENVLGVSTEEYYSFIRIGKLCELVFSSWLHEQGVGHEAPDMLLPHAAAHRLGADLQLTLTGQEVDVKAANKAFHKRILIREDQFAAHQHDIYIGAKYHSDTCVTIHGYATASDLQASAVQDFGYGPCRALLLEQLKPMKLFLAYLELGEKVR